MVNRSATDTINGFYYQFLHTINLCLDSFFDRTNTTILCEGKEDIDCIRENNEVLIQVKTSKNKVNIAKPSFKSSMINFYKEYLKNKDTLFVLHTNATPCSEIINGEKTNTLDIWSRCSKKNWSDTDLSSLLLGNLKIILEDYIKDSKIQNLDLSNFDTEFLKRVFIEFDMPDSSLYEPIIKESIQKRYPHSNGNYRNLLFLNLLNLVIKKSIEHDIENRRITYDIFTDTISEAENILENSYKDIVICNEDRSQKLSLNDITIKIDKIINDSSEIRCATDNLTNNHLIEKVEVPEQELKVYSEYPFVIKLNEASIPGELIFDAKNNFYQAEYAMRKADVFSSSQKTSTIDRLKKTIKTLYTYEYVNAKTENLNSIKLLLNMNNKIISEHNNVLACNLGFDFFHKIGLMQHVSNEDGEVTWKLENE